MTSPLTNTRSGSFHKIELLNSTGDFQDLLSLVSAGEGLTTLTAAGGGITITGTGASRTLTVDLSAMARIASVNSALAGKIETLVAGAGVTITGSGAIRTIAASGGTALQLNGATQAATTLNFVGAVRTLVGNVLSIAPQPLINSGMDLALQDATQEYKGEWLNVYP